MNINKVFNNIKILFLAFTILALANLFNNKAKRPYFQISKQESTLNFNEVLIAKYNVGLKRLISATLWISTILESDIDHYKGQDLNSWMFLRFNSISIIDPNFFETYLFGGTYLSIVKDDLPGASIIYNKGIKLFPDNVELLKSAGFHFYFEANDLNSAYPIYQKLIKLAPNNPIVVATFSRMMASNGGMKDALEILDGLQNKYEPDSELGKKIFSYRYAIKAELDLNCLNTSSQNCSLVDLEGKPYIKKSNIFEAQKPWKPYRIKRR